MGDEIRYCAGCGTREPGPCPSDCILPGCWSEHIAPNAEEQIATLTIERDEALAEVNLHSSTTPRARTFCVVRLRATNQALTRTVKDGYAEVMQLRAEVRRLRAEVERLRERIGRLLSDNGCDCPCDHDSESHDETCARCLACRIDAALREHKDPPGTFGVCSICGRPCDSDKVMHGDCHG